MQFDSPRTPPWWTDHEQVVAFARVLVEAEQFGDCQHAVIDYFAAPWKWSRQHALWLEIGCPEPFAASFDALVGLLT